MHRLPSFEGFTMHSPQKVTLRPMQCIIWSRLQGRWQKGNVFYLSSLSIFSLPVSLSPLCFQNLLCSLSPCCWMTFSLPSFVPMYLAVSLYPSLLALSQSQPLILPVLAQRQTVMLYGFSLPINVLTLALPFAGGPLRHPCTNTAWSNDRPRPP